MIKKYVQFTIGAAGALRKVLVSASADYVIDYATTSTLVLTGIGGIATGLDVITITFTTADASYASHAAVVNALALANMPNSRPECILEPALPLVGATQQLITSVVIA